MELDFSKIKNAVTRQFNEMVRHDVFRADVTGDEVWDTYINGFPEGTNPMFRERREHDCSCCRNFVRSIGNVVAVIDGKRVGLWDMDVGDPDYQVVVDKLAKLVASKPLINEFLHPERTAGTDKNYEDKDGKVRTWNHFFVNIPHARNQGKNYFCKGEDIATKLGASKSSYDVLERGLRELTVDAMESVLDLISQNGLYRGNEHKNNIEAFLKLKKQYDKLKTDIDRNAFVWSNAMKLSGAVSRIRNTSIGTLLIDISEGKDLDHAVRLYESIVAPHNYKRPTAVVTQKMIDAAKKTVDALGLLPSIEGRRYARLTDINVSNIIFANQSSRKVMKGEDIFAALTPTKKSSPKSLSKIETVTIDKFIADIVPNVDTIEVMVENRHVSNLVSLIAPTEQGTKPLFKWDNNFSWSYNGDMADSIKERVKKAGGSVEGDLCCRLAWYNHDDLDFHMQEPGGYEIYYGNRSRLSTSGGMLDVDMNAGSGTTREPVENIFYRDRSRMKEGIYTLSVHQFSKRESDNIGFDVEFDYLGEVQRFSYDKSLRQKQIVVVARFKYSRAKGIEMLESLDSTPVSKTIWNLQTQDFHRVNVLMTSPNHWDEKGIGNKHYFFMLDGCKNEGSARGFFNEFLNSDLEKHRKVLELIGSKIRTEETDNQLSGLGFSDTKRNEIMVRVKGNFTRTLKVMI